MGTKVYQKLIRDNIPDIIEKTGAKPVVRRLSGREYRAGLNRKLREEVGEYLEAETAEELADIVEVVYAILDASGMRLEEFEQIRLQKRKNNGGFTKRYDLESVETN